MQLRSTSKFFVGTILSAAAGWLFIANANATPTVQQLDQIHQAAKVLTKAETLYKSGKLPEAADEFEAAQKALVELAESGDLTKQLAPLVKRLVKLHGSLETDGAKVSAVATELTTPPAPGSGKSASLSKSAVSPERPVGWRGDGSGRYPDANPPIAWERKLVSGGYTTSGILWMAPMPDNGVSSPIIVGDRIFITSEPSDLICLDKKSGQILWIRSNPEFEGLPESERKAEPEYAQTVAPLAGELAALNGQVATVLNAAMFNPAAARVMEPALKQKRELEKKIQTEQAGINKKAFTHNWAQAVFGYAGPTPTSDGTHVCAFFTTGISVCYDLNGNRKWIARGEGGGSEHGNFASPLLCGNRLIVWANEMRAYDVDTGKLAWTNPAKGYNTYGSMFRVRVGKELVAGFQWGFFTRVRDGLSIWDQGVFGDSVQTPIVEGDFILARVGYPKNNDELLGFKAFRIPPSTDSGKLEPAVVYKMNWGDDELPIDKKRNPFDRGYVASPLYVDGLVYQVSQGGGLIVNDAVSGEQVYRKVLPLKPRTEYWNWSGCAASPTLAGKYIYLMDNQGKTLIIESGRKYKEVATNMLEESKDGKDQAQTLASPVFEGNKMYYRTPGFIYCIGKK